MISVPYLDFKVTGQEYKRWIGEDSFILNMHDILTPSIFNHFIKNLKRQIVSWRIEQLAMLAQSWFDAIETGTANKRLPRLNGDEAIPSKEEVDDFITRVDGFFERELYVPATKTVKTYWQDRGVGLLPNFNRLEGGARLAFFQDWRRTKKRLNL